MIAFSMSSMSKEIIFYKLNVLALYKTDFVMGIDMVRKA
jgi:hypothetical protein